MKLNSQIEQKIIQHTRSEIISIKPVAGGRISDAFKLEMKSGDNYFLKLNYIFSNDMFIKEANGLNELKKTAVIRVPSVILAEKSFILMEYIEAGAKTKNFLKTSELNLRSYINLKGIHSDFMKIILLVPTYKEIFPVMMKRMTG